MTDHGLQPAWLRELGGSLGTSAQFVLFGNIRDQIPLTSESGRTELLPTIVDALWSFLALSGYRFLCVFDPIDGLRVWPETDEAREAAAAALGRQVDQQREVTLERLRADLRAVVHAEDVRAGFVIDYGSRMVANPQQLSDAERDFFAFVEKLSHTAVPRRVDERAVPVFNPVVWIAETDRDFPGWLIGANDSLRVIAVPRPDLSARLSVARLIGESFEDFRGGDEDAQGELCERFAQQTDGMTVNAMFAIATLADDQGLGMGRIDDAARAHRVGVVDNPWADASVRERIQRGESELKGRVVGQGKAITKSLDILKRSATGLTGAHASPYSIRPRGVLFFAGPTGVGKTELAKQLTRLVFGDEQSYIRFDMSEFSSEHNAARLIGAPPGYTGFDAGGELTNAVRERPFCLLLFDEIEKADGRILDKFLQILEDGRLTDGRGDTVFFSEAIIVFTSNLGIYTRNDDGHRVPNVTAEMNVDEADGRVRDAIGDYFVSTLGRPELLNRLGDNIVVFDFIRRDSGKTIFELLCANVAARVMREHGCELALSPEANEYLLELALADLRNGGRGIGSVIETSLVNPLARAIFAAQLESGRRVVVKEIRETESGYEAVLA